MKAKFAMLLTAVLLSAVATGAVSAIELPRYD
jgi:hypothetical protein